MKTLLIDNYDSFTYNLFHMIAAINGELPLVIKNDELSWEALQSLAFDNIIISPGPGHPDISSDFGICQRVLLEMTCPILGVCLGHQGMFSVFGGEVVSADTPMHGRISNIIHHGDSLFTGVPAMFQAVRYHSLIADRKSLPDCLTIIAETEDKQIMAIRHQSRLLWGLQFHPESISSEFGAVILKNFNQITKASEDSTPHISVLNTTKHYQAVVPALVRESYASASSTTNTLKVLCKSMPTSHTAIQIYDHLYPNKHNTIWLDSSRDTNDVSRFSYLGCAEEGPLSYLLQYDVSTKAIKITKKGKITYHTDNLLPYLQQVLRSHQPEPTPFPFDFIGGFVGYLGYELKQETMGIQNHYTSSLPDASLLFLDRVIVFDHQEKTLYLVALTSTEFEREAGQWLKNTENGLQSLSSLTQKEKNVSSTTSQAKFSRDQQTYLNDIAQCLQHIQAGESYEMCLTNKVHFQTNMDSYQYYIKLRQMNPTPYSAYMQLADCAIACSSMERYLKIDTQGNVESKPIKGTLPRGKTPQEDEALKLQLQIDEKFRAENLMIVDLVRNDLSIVCDIGSVHVPALMHVESYQTVHQLMSTIRGKLRTECDAIDCIKATFPGGSMTGAPKRRTVMLLEDLEKEARGIYSGAIGYLSVNGAADFNIVIRTAVFTENQLSIGVGGAITSLSEPQAEFDEMVLKAKILEKVVATNPSLRGFDALSRGNPSAT